MSMENFPKPAQPTAEELERIEEERKASDRDLIDGGVRHIINDHGRVELRPTEEQIEAARKEMKTDMLVKEIVAMRKKEIEKTPEKKEEDAESGNMTAIKEYHEKWLKEGNSSAENKEKKTQTEKPLGENKEPNKEISNKTLEKANFLNLKKEDLRKIDSFNGLSEAQQILVLEGLNQLAVEESKAKAFSKQQEEMKQAGLFGRFVKGFTKESKLIKLEREAFNEATTGGIKAHGELIKALSEIAEKGPEVELEKDGGVKIKYLGESVFGKDGLNGPEKRQLNYFNDIANRLSLIPEEHSFKTAGKKERKEYDKMFGEYEEAKKKMMETLEKNGLDEKTIFQKMNEVENNIKLNQFLNANPDIEKYIEGVKGRGRLSRELLTKVGGKVFYGGVGYVSRVVPIAAFGAVGAPLGAAAFGGYMAGLRARKELINREKASRKGVEDAKAGAKNFVKVEDSPNEFGIATGLIGKLKKLLEEEDQIKNSEMQESEKEIALKKLNERLAARISYTQEKIDAGLVNYGKGGDAMLNRFNLIESLSGAIVKSEMAGFSGNNLEDIKKLTRKRGDFEYGNKIFRKGELSFQEKAHMEMMGIPYREISEEQEKARGEARKNLSLEDRMRSFLDFRGEAISARQKDYIYKKALKGAAISAGFAFGGYAIRHFAGEWFGWDKGGAGVIKGETQTGVDLKPPSTSYDAELITEKTDIGAEGIEKYSSDPRMAFEAMEEKPRISAEDYAKIKNYFTTDETERFIFRVNNFQDEGKIIANIIESGNDEYISKILNPDNYEFLEGLHYARDFGGEKGFNLILRKMEDGSVKFGIDGPGALGRYNWGEGGKSWLFKANADFTESNLREAL
ncbi:MAG: hypothetical protein COV02_01140, partial [Candidatus Terrybacteria bacterium CG10_big_fil_rev_8_21_14_0_10_41_10]